MAAFEPVLTRNVGKPEALTLNGYRQLGGYEALAKALKMEPDAVIDEVKKSGLRGRGGAGFPAGMKWSFIPKGKDKPQVPGLQRRRVRAGHLQGPAADGVRPPPAHRGVRHLLLRRRRPTPATSTSAASTPRPPTILERALKEAYEGGILGDSVLGSGFKLDMYVHRGAGAYICGEETGMLESLEGKRGQPRVKPPFPAVVGAFGAPTVINNVETLCNVPHIIDARRRLVQGDRHRREEHRPQALRHLGPRRAAGHLRVPDRRHLPRAAGRLRRHAARGGELKAFIPGGASAPILQGGPDRHQDGLRHRGQGRLDARARRPSS